MGKAWAAKDVADLIKLIDDPRHKLLEDGTIYLSEERRRGLF